jgi:hypothetical protein
VIDAAERFPLADYDSEIKPWNVRGLNVTNTNMLLAIVRFTLQLWTEDVREAGKMSDVRRNSSHQADALQCQGPAKRTARTHLDLNAHHVVAVDEDTQSTCSQSRTLGTMSTTMPQLEECRRSYFVPDEVTCKKAQHIANIVMQCH